MDTIEFIAILVSIVVGLAMAEVLQGFADSLRHRSSLRGYWPLFVFGALVVTMSIWTVRWLWLSEGLSFWTWGELALALAPGLIVFVMARLTFPQELADSDLRAYYFDQSKSLWSLAALFVVTAEVRVLTLGASVPLADAQPAAHVMRLVAFLLCLILATSKRPLIHEVGLGLAVVLLIARIATSYVAFGGPS